MSLFRRSKAEANLIRDIINGGQAAEEALKYIYNKLGFFEKGKKHLLYKGKITVEEAEDIAIQAIFELYNAIKNKNYSPDKGKLITYFMRIVNNKRIDHFKRKKSTEDIEQYSLPGYNQHFDNDLDVESARKTAIEILTSLGLVCRKILVWSSRGFENKEIAQLLGPDWDNRRVSNRKNKCRKKLRTHYQKEFEQIKEHFKNLPNGL